MIYAFKKTDHIRVGTIDLGWQSDILTTQPEFYKQTLFQNGKNLKQSKIKN